MCHVAEHEITGDVLLDLDVNLLKSELEITAFGKRMRIANAIAELKRPASVVSSELLQQPHHQRQVSQSVSLPNSANLSLHSPLSAWQSGYGSARGDGASTINGSGTHSPSAYTFAQAGHMPHSADLSAGLGARQFRQGSEPASSVRMSVIDNSEQTATSTTAASSATGLGVIGNGVEGGYRGQPVRIQCTFHLRISLLIDLTEGPTCPTRTLAQRQLVARISEEP